jgi:hypothetical protein
MEILSLAFLTGLVLALSVAPLEVDIYGEWD